MDSIEQCQPALSEVRGIFFKVKQCQKRSMNEPKLLVFEEASNAIARIHGGQVTFSF